MSLHENVLEQVPPLTTLQVFHRHLKVPMEVYLNTVQEFSEPWDERTYQFFVYKYLEESGDNGIVGMVRPEKDDDYVYLDAAVRYPQKTGIND